MVAAIQKSPVGSSLRLCGFETGDGFLHRTCRCAAFRSYVRLTKGGSITFRWCRKMQDFIAVRTGHTSYLRKTLWNSPFLPCLPPLHEAWLLFWATWWLAIIETLVHGEVEHLQVENFRVYATQLLAIASPSLPQSDSPSLLKDSPSVQLMLPTFRNSPAILCSETLKNKNGHRWAAVFDTEQSCASEVNCWSTPPHLIAVVLKASTFERNKNSKNPRHEEVGFPLALPAPLPLEAFSPEVGWCLRHQLPFIGGE